MGRICIDLKIIEELFSLVYTAGKRITCTTVVAVSVLWITPKRTHKDSGIKKKRGKVEQFHHREYIETVCGPPTYETLSEGMNMF